MALANSATPSILAEDHPQKHDCVSIAAECDNDCDLTLIGSSQLVPETNAHCPFCAWSARETLWVVRSCNAVLGQWCTGERYGYAEVEIRGGDKRPRESLDRSALRWRTQSTHTALQRLPMSN